MATVFLYMSWVNGWCQVAAVLAATADPVSHRMTGLPRLQTLSSRVTRKKPLGAASSPQRSHFLRSRS
jgi:hypothetical protein